MDFQEDFISEIRQYSLNISEYLDNKLYRVDVEDVDVLSPNVIFNLVMNMVIDELGIMGIDIHARNEVYTEVSLVKAIQFLRINFDKKSFGPLVARTPELGEYICAVVDSDEVDHELFAINVITWLQRNFPLSTVWEHLIRNEEYFLSKPEFMDHLCRLVQDANTLTAQIDFDHLIPKYVQCVVEHINKVKDCARFLAIHPAIDNKVLADTFMMTLENHDQELPSLMPGEFIENYIDENDPHPAYSARGIDHPAILGHKLSSPHHLEYYYGQTEVTTIATEALITIASDLFRPTWELEANLKTLRELFAPTSLDLMSLNRLEYMMHTLSTRGSL